MPPNPLTHIHTYYIPEPSSCVRRSALKARKSLTRNAYDSLEQSGKTIQAVKRRRKQRHIKLKEMAREEEKGNSKDSWSRWFAGEVIVCPVCSATVRGDQDVVDAHVDSCLANETRRMEEARTRELRHQQAMQEELGEDGEEELRYPGHIGSVRGMFSILINHGKRFKILKVPDFTHVTATSKT
jgi:hypothetical protein